MYKGGVRDVQPPLETPSKIKGSRAIKKSNTYQDVSRRLNRDILPYPSGGKNPQENDIMALPQIHGALKKIELRHQARIPSAHPTTAERLHYTAPERR